MGVMGPAKRAHLEARREVIDPPFSLQEYDARVLRIREAMSRAQIDCLFLSAPESIYYVSGYACEWYQASSPEPWWPASGVAIHVDHEHFIHFEHTQEATLLQLTTMSRDVRLTEAEGRAQQAFVVDELAAAGWLKGVVGLEMNAYRPGRLASEAFERGLTNAGARVVDGTAIVRGVRRRKSTAELEYVRRAQEIADIGMAAARASIGVGVTELEVYGAMVQAMASAGGEVAAIPLPVVSGPRAATVHGLAGRRRMEQGDLVGVDLCGVYHRYHANLARTFSIGEPSAPVRSAIDHAYGATQVFNDALEPGACVNEVMARLEDYYRTCGLLNDQWWVGGYELGVAFPPDWVGEFLYSMGDDHGPEFFADGDVFNFEANFYLPENAGIVLVINTAVVDGMSAGLIHGYPDALTVIET